MAHLLEASSHAWYLEWVPVWLDISQSLCMSWLNLMFVTGALSGLIVSVILFGCQCMMHQCVALDLGFRLTPYLQSGMACGRSYSVRSELVVLGCFFQALL